MVMTPAATTATPIATPIVRRLRTACVLMTIPPEGMDRLRFMRMASDDLGDSLERPYPIIFPDFAQDSCGGGCRRDRGYKRRNRRGRAVPGVRPLCARPRKRTAQRSRWSDPHRPQGLWHAEHVARTAGQPGDE